MTAQLATANEPDDANDTGEFPVYLSLMRAGRVRKAFASASAVGANELDAQPATHDDEADGLHCAPDLEMDLEQAATLGEVLLEESRTGDFIDADLGPDD